MILSLHPKFQCLIDQQYVKCVKSDIHAVLDVILTILISYLSIDKYIFLAYIGKPVLKQSLPVDLFVLSAM